MHTNLSGIWKATADLGQQAKAGKPGFAPGSAWTDLPVPGHWQEAPGLEGFTGRLLYRRSFDLDRAPSPGESARLRFDGIFYGARIWCNGAYLGDQQGYFVPHSYDVTRHLRPGENVVMAEVGYEPEESGSPRQQITGLFGDWEGKPPAMEPGGIWRDVWVEYYPGVVPERFRLAAAPDQSPPTQDGTATVSFELEFQALGEGRLTWSAQITPETFAGETIHLDGDQGTHRGWNRLNAALSLAQPRFWWTWDHGTPDLYRLTLELSWNGGPPQRLERLFGVRTVALQEGHLYLNGRRIYVRGAAYGPPTMRLAGVGREAYRRDLTLMREANLNLLRALAHVGKPELYEEASRQGLLIWQDFPLYRLHSRSVLEEAKGQAAAMVDLLGHWPAIGLWCCHAEPFPADDPTEQNFIGRSLAYLSGLTGNWNRSTLAPALQSVVRAADPSRPVLGHPGDWAGTRAPAPSWGWHTGKLAGLAAALRIQPEAARFMYGFGAQAFPNLEQSERFVRGEWPNLNWDDLQAKQMLDLRNLRRRVPLEQAKDLESYISATQEYQASVLRAHVEQVRQLKYQPSGGVLYALFADAAPGVTFAVLDHAREHKAGYDALRDAFRPVTIMADWPEEQYSAGRRITLRLFVVNDLHQPFDGGWTWAIVREGRILVTESRPIAVRPDSLTTVPAAIDWAVPTDMAPGPVRLVLTLELEGISPVITRYEIGVLSAI